MHAASVHPEPGSNSLKNVISTALAAKTFFRAKILASSYFLSSLNVFFEIPSHNVLCSKFCCSIFKDRMLVPRASSQRPSYSTTALSLCQPLFENFFLFFSFPSGLLFGSSSVRCGFAPLSSRARLVYHFSTHFVNPFFEKNLKKYISQQKKSVKRVFFYI